MKTSEPSALLPMKRAQEAIDALRTQGQHPLSLLANAMAHLAWALEDINWVGIYLRQGDELFLGPFFGRPACTPLQRGQGVCWAALSAKQTLNVPDVQAFPGHIACDAASRSELVIPFIHKGESVGVLDVDSPRLNRFTAAEAALLEDIAALLAPAAAQCQKNL
ncbi:Free methionine-(R)-sulfoxide reductase, contains GAF domain [Clostridiaceae bacterium JG1575]|nr:Free methionine-(R)-sulfoxide reductase, contains GAF domain [Clostridiaceae bacterium JG1575]